MAAWAAASQSMLSASSCSAFPPKRIHGSPYRPISGSKYRLCTVHTSSDESDCNTEECAPDKEPTVYVAESVISSGSAGTSAEGSENTAAIVGGLAPIAVAAASSILIQVGKNPLKTQTSDYSGPPLTY